MQVNVIEDSKQDLTIELDNVTIAELLRVYLDGEADFAAWRREHPSKPVIFKVSSEKGAAKSIVSACGLIRKECEKIKNAVKK